MKRGDLAAKPKYVQIQELIIESIEGQAPNTPISSERDIATQLMVSRMTVRKAIDALCEEGILYRHKNKGTYIADKKLRKTGSPLLILEAQEQDSKYKTLYFDIKSRDDDNIYEQLRWKEDDQYLRVVRLVLKADVPYSIEEIYISRSNTSSADLKNLDKVLDLEAYIADGILNQVFNPMLVPTQYANLLKIKLNEPIIRVDSLISHKTGIPYVFIRSYYNPNIMKIEITF